MDFKHIFAVIFRPVNGGARFFLQINKSNPSAGFFRNLTSLPARNTCRRLTNKERGLDTISNYLPLVESTTCLRNEINSLHCYGFKLPCLFDQVYDWGFGHLVPKPKTIFNHEVTPLAFLSVIKICFSKKEKHMVISDMLENNAGR